MDFNFTEEHEMIRRTAREFAEEVLAKTAAERDREERFFKDELAQLAELGFFGIAIPEEYDGAGMDNIAYLIAVEEISRVDAAVAVAVSVTNSLVAYPLYHFGNEDQKNKYLKPLASGKMLGGFCLTEPTSGSDALDMRTTAVLDGDHYIINGSKNFVSSGLHADVFMLTATTDPTKGSRGTSVFIMDRDLPGIVYGAKEKKLGIRSSDTVSLTLEDVRIPVFNRIGEEGMGFRISMTALDSGRLGIAAQALGIAQGAFEEGMKYASIRKQFGRFLKDFQAIQFKLADMESRIQASRLLIYKAAFMKDQNKRCTKEAATAKLFASETASFVVDQALQIHGGYGYTKDYPIERMWRDARITQIYEGTSEIQRMVIARALYKEYSLE